MKPSLLTLFAALAVAGPAAAGPYYPEWSYTTTFSGDRGNFYVDAGYGGRPDVSAPDGSGFRHYQGYIKLTPAVPSPNPTASGDSTVVLGSTPGYTNFYWMEEPDPFPAGGQLDALAKMSITVKDKASGAEHAVSITRDLTHGTQDSYLGTPVTFFTPTEPYVEEFWLGLNLYKVTLHEARGPNSPDLTGPTQLVVADVMVLPVADAPEPGTLALGGIALAGAGLTRLRRWKMRV